jgi:hypothetical protein
MEKEFVTYELALKMKVLGFDEPCLAIYDNYTDENDKDDSDRFFYIRTEGWPKELFDRVTPVPLFSQAFRWFRKNYRLSVLIHDCLDDYIGEIVEWTISEDKVIHEVPSRIETYEEAELACLEKLIEIVESK